MPFFVTTQNDHELWCNIDMFDIDCYKILTTRNSLICTSITVREIDVYCVRHDNLSNSHSQLNIIVILKEVMPNARTFTLNNNLT